MGESMGKTNQALTPSVAIATQDLHSILQLYLGGPDDKITTFITNSKPDATTMIPSRENRVFDIDKEISGIPMSSIKTAIYDGVKESYKKRGLSFYEVKFSDLDAYNLGWFMQYKMIEIMFLCDLFRVNTFDQPAVEFYKMSARKSLAADLK
jgi:glucose-6-phosphate isomerase